MAIAYEGTESSEILFHMHNQHEKQFALDPNPTQKPPSLFGMPVTRSNIRLKRFKNLSRSLQYALLHTVWTDNGNIIVVKNSKAGCTTVTQAIYYEQTGVFYSDNIHREKALLNQGYRHWERSLQNLNKESSRRRITSVRNPEDRIVSAYKDFVTRRNKSWHRHEEMLENYGVLDEPLGAKGLEKFLDFVSDFHQYDAISVDRHFRRQIINIAFGEIEYDFIGHIETFESWAPIWFPGINNQSFRFAKHNQSFKTKIEINGKLKKKIKKIYQDDFDIFGY
jgi:hypothetical protein